jgi:hypothetical protein
MRSGSKARARPAKPKPFLRQLARVRKICLALPDATEKLSHGEPTFFVKQGVFAMFDNNHHGMGRVAIWLPAPLGLQEFLIEQEPGIYFRPPYVGVAGWIGVELDQVDAKTLSGHIHAAWSLIANKKKKKRAKR